MEKRGYPDGSVGIVVPWGDEYAPGKPALLSERTIKLVDAELFKTLFTIEGDYKIEVIDTSTESEFNITTTTGFYPNVTTTTRNPVKEVYPGKALKITGNITLYPKFLPSPRAYLVIHALTSKNGGSITFGTLPPYQLAPDEMGNTYPIVGGISTANTKITISGTVFLFMIEVYLEEDNYIPAEVLYHSESSTSAFTHREILIPPGFWVVQVNLIGAKDDAGKTVSLLINGKHLADVTGTTASYMPNTTFFNRDAYPLYVDVAGSLTLSASSDITAENYGVYLYRIGDRDYSNPKASTYTASETSTTASTTTAMSDVKPHRFRNISVKVSIASGGGSVKVLMNGNVVAEYDSSGTYTLPDFENITKLAFEVAGDGTNASSVTFTAIEEVKDLIVASLL